MQREIDGETSNEDGEEGITLQWAVRRSKSKYNEGGKHYLCSEESRRKEWRSLSGYASWKRAATVEDTTT